MRKDVKYKNLSEFLHVTEGLAVKNQSQKLGGWCKFEPNRMKNGQF